MGKLFDTMLNNKQVKRLVVERSITYNIPLKFICWEVGVDYENFMRQYINPQNESSLEITEEKFEKVLWMLGISIRYQFIVDNSRDIVKENENVIKKAVEYYDNLRQLTIETYEKRQNEKKRSASKSK